MKISIKVFILTLGVSIFCNALLAQNIKDSLAWNEDEYSDKPTVQMIDSFQNGKVQKNTIFIEAFGNCLLYSINYDRLLLITPKRIITGRIGGGSLQLGNQKSADITTELNMLTDQFKGFMAIGIGLTCMYLNDKFPSSSDETSMHNITDNIIFTSLRLGYRSQKPQGGFFWNAGIVLSYAAYQRRYGATDPSISKKAFPDLLFMPGIGAGYTLKLKQ